MGCEKGHIKNRVMTLFARRLRNWRKKKGYPLKHVAIDMGVSVSIVSEWENANRFPCVDHLDKIAKYTGMPVCTFFYSGEGNCSQGI